MTTADAVATAFYAACAEELDAPKPGNVHVHAAGHGMTTADFLLSAKAAAPHLARSGAPLGARILAAVQATRAAVGQNTNLGILLLCAPLAAAMQSGTTDLRADVRRVIAGSTLADAADVFQAITIAAPGGLGGAAQHDVRWPAKVTLPIAMAEAAERDRIAHNWTHGFGDVFELGLPAHAAALQRWPDRRWATLAVYLRFLAAFPDTHVLRKHGSAAAGLVRDAAVEMAAHLQAAESPAVLLPDLLAWDAGLKRDGINPGTSADLTVAVLFAERLNGILAAKA